MWVCFRETPDRVIVSFSDPEIAGGARVGEGGDGLGDFCQRAALTGKRLVVNFRGILSMSSAMLGALVLLDKRAKQLSVDLRIADIGPNVLEVFRITRLESVFRRDDDDPDSSGSAVPRPKPPGTLDAGVNVPSG